MIQGDPIRIGYSGTPGSTSVAIGLFLPGTNNPYTLLNTDFIYFTSLLCEATGVVDLLSLAAGNSTVASSTLLASFLSTGYWHDGHSEALSGPQGVLPSIYTPTSTTTVNLTGTGFVVKSPGTTRPTFLAGQVPMG